MNCQGTEYCGAEDCQRCYPQPAPEPYITDEQQERAEARVDQLIGRSRE